MYQKDNQVHQADCDVGRTSKSTASPHLVNTRKKQIKADMK